ncbi:podoplanin isoform X2 [Mixophyes fleayi]|uniref:podoplanin isoform X2 n=1 Tax=Mixophyes fleayi TaxID=3061075 RepID=UPI003F4E2986
MKMLKTQSLLCLLAGLTLCAVTAEVTVLPDIEAETINVSENSFENSSEPQTQTTDAEISGSTLYDRSTEGFFTMETATQTTDNSTYVVVIEDPEDGVDMPTLIGIVAGIISVIGVSAMIIILLVRKMGRYSP